MLCVKYVIVYTCVFMYVNCVCGGRMQSLHMHACGGHRKPTMIVLQTLPTGVALTKKTRLRMPGPQGSACPSSLLHWITSESHHGWLFYRCFRDQTQVLCLRSAWVLSPDLYIAFQVCSFCLRKSVSKDLQVECRCKENVDKENRSAARWKTLQAKRAVWVMNHTPPSRIFSFERVSSFPKDSTFSVFSIRKQTVLQFPLPSFNTFWRSTWSLHFKSTSVDFWRLERWLSH